MTDTTKRDEVLARFEDPRFDPVAARYGGHRIQRQRMADRIVELEELALAERATVMRQAEELTRLRAILANEPHLPHIQIDRGTP